MYFKFTDCCTVAAHRIAAGVNSRSESTRHPRGAPARPALPIGRRDARAFSVRGHASTLGRSMFLRPSTSLITGAVRKQPPGCFVLLKALRHRELFLLFSFHRRKAMGVTSPKTSGGRRDARPRHQGKKIPPFPSLPPLLSKQPIHAHNRAPTHMHTRAIARAFANAPRFRYVLLLAVGPI